ncbi:MAG: hypothetical protein C0507_09280 [Cyanobacteria bacterium PR.3.49]|nr:hypothetical protein [Cyanobacteria bacterium PR.3.49]
MVEQESRLEITSRMDVMMAASVAVAFAGSIGRLNFVAAALAENYRLGAHFHGADDQSDPEKNQQCHNNRIFADALAGAQVRTRMQVLPQYCVDSLAVLESDDSEPAEDHDSQNDVNAVHDVKKRRQG